MFSIYIQDRSPMERVKDAPGIAEAPLSYMTIREDGDSLRH